MKLAALQAEFQEALLSGGDAIPSLVRNGSRERRDVLFDVYRNGYMLRLVEFIENDHDILHTYLGDEAFDALARAYAAANPSRHRSARHFCGRLPEFLAATEPYAGEPQLAEIASLERALNDAFDAADAPVLDIAALAAFAPEAWTRLVFVPHPSVRRLDFSTDAAAIWTALKEERDPPVPELLRGRQRLLVWRQEIAKFRVVGEEESMLWDEAARGVCFGVLCEMAAAFDAPDQAAMRAASYLRGWIGCGLISAVRLD